ncbi:MAG: VRR-NUC domain-containing protein [Oleiphilaceae bacterium]|nr:VRR-NUC domain-containing protein [Oleiphilaceae bacterium]
MPLPSSVPSKPAPTQGSAEPRPASLDNPLYYLENFRTLLRWVMDHHGDLLLPEEMAQLREFEGLPQPAQALLVRLIMRTGALFRVDKLNYAELGQPVRQALTLLISARWVDPDPLLGLDDLFRLLNKAEWLQAFGTELKAARIPRTATKKIFHDTLAEKWTGSDTLTGWWSEAPEPIIALNGGRLFQRMQLMFFGNLRQSWSEFVLAELGHQKYEKVPLTPESRAFQRRDQVDIYLHLQTCRDRLELAGEPLADIRSDIPARLAGNPWLESRRGRLLFELGKLAEREGRYELALHSYNDSGHREARLRQLRLMERQGDYQQAYRLAMNALGDPRNASESRGLVRLIARLAKKLAKPPLPTEAPAIIPHFQLNLARPTNGSVEWAVLEHLSGPGAPVFYVENTLLNGLFALLCWPALYAPLPGAFFHPFHAAPADLYREDFVSRRSKLFRECLAHLETGGYRDHILRNWAAKQGTTSPFLHWPLLRRELVEMALDCIPARHLTACFGRMLADLKIHRSGLPDLIQFWPEQKDYRLVEVKGPGDRLQDHQRQWLEFGLSEGMAMTVCYVTWQDAI